MIQAARVFVARPTVRWRADGNSFFDCPVRPKSALAASKTGRTVVSESFSLWSRSTQLGAVIAVARLIGRSTAREQIRSSSRYII